VRDVSQQQGGERFLAAFNDIEGHFRAVLNVGDYVDFGQLTRDYSAKNRLPYQYLDAQRVFASLRNAISHGRFYGGRPIANPVEDVVGQIEQLRDQILATQKAYAVLGPMNVCVARLADPIAAVLEHVRRFDYSQLPVYNDNSYVGILTTNTIARWLADQFSRNAGMAEEEPVSNEGYSQDHQL
jgi:CBS domain